MAEIATCKLDWISPNGTVTPLCVRVSAPYEDNGCWRCPLAIDGLQSPHATAGEDSLQAISLALKLTHFYLRALLENGGQLFYASTESAFDLDAYFSEWPTVRDPKSEAAPDENGEPKPPE